MPPGPILTIAERTALEASYGGGLVDFVHRLRHAHAPTFITAESWALGGVLVHTGCRCGEVGCQVAPLLVHISNLIAAYEAKCADLAAETARHIEVNELPERAP